MKKRGDRHGEKIDSSGYWLLGSLPILVAKSSTLVSPSFIPRLPTFQSPVSTTDEIASFVEETSHRVRSRTAYREKDGPLLGTQ